MLNVVEFFSGIGAQAKALERIKERTPGFDFNILHTADWDIYAIIAYDLIHNGAQEPDKYKELSKDELIERLLGYTFSPDGKDPYGQGGLCRCNIELLRRLLIAIERTNNLVSITDIAGNSLPKEIDVMTYSFPCQNLSVAGVMHGVMTGIDRDVKNRSGMLWEVERILKERDGENEEGYVLPLPQFLLMENVATLRAPRHSKYFGEWKEFLVSKGYYNIEYKLEAYKFGIPQTRTRLFMISVWLGRENSEYIEKKQLLEEFLVGKSLENDEEYIASLGITTRKLEDILRVSNCFDAEARACVMHDTPSRNRIVENNLYLYQNNAFADALKTITTKQDRDPCAGLVEYPNQMDGMLPVRYLTPRECLLGMGFDDCDYEVLMKNNFKANRKNMFFSDSKIYKMAGNSIVVNVLEAIFMQIIEIKKLLEADE